ncbi:MAG: undecaprenyl-diphosphate phosphatase [Bacteroidales bacterium]|nr:undecaprenyl-diphosphate phosphatase [Bacteroidales bacterium]
MDWLQALLLGLVQGLTEFLPVSSSGHLAIGKALLGVEPSEDLVFEVTVHAATVLATIVVFRKEIWKLLCGLFKFKYNDETDYIAKICLSMIPVFIVGMFFKDKVESAFNSMLIVGLALIVTAMLLVFSDWKTQRGFGKLCSGARKTGEKGSEAEATEATEGQCRESGGDLCPKVSGDAGQSGTDRYRNGISFWQALVVGIGQAFAVIPGLSRSGTTISTGLICGVKRSNMAQFSFLMVLVPILGEAFLDVVGGDMAASSTGFLPLAVGFVAAFISGLFACKVMIALVRKAQLKWFGLYCALVGLAVLIFMV